MGMEGCERAWCMVVVMVVVVVVVVVPVVAGGRLWLVGGGWCGGGGRLVVRWVGGPVMSARLRLKAQGLVLRVSGIEFTSKGVSKGCQC